jgi:hypothetical protein
MQFYLITEWILSQWLTNFFLTGTDRKYFRLVDHLFFIPLKQLYCCSKNTALTICKRMSIEYSNKIFFTKGGCMPVGHSLPSPTISQHTTLPYFFFTAFLYYHICFFLHKCILMSSVKYSDKRLQHEVNDAIYFALSPYGDKALHIDCRKVHKFTCEHIWNMIKR